MIKLIFIPMMFAFTITMGQTLNPASIIGKPVKIGNLLVAQNDFPNVMNWNDAKKACNELGKGWRLPTKEELNIIYQNKDKIGGFAKPTYWSFTEFNLSNVKGTIFIWRQYFTDGTQSPNDKTNACFVRAVKVL